MKILQPLFPRLAAMALAVGGLVVAAGTVAAQEGGPRDCTLRPDREGMIRGDQIPVGCLIREEVDEPRERRPRRTGPPGFIVTGTPIFFLPGPKVIVLQGRVGLPGRLRPADADLRGALRVRPGNFGPLLRPFGPISRPFGRTHRPSSSSRPGPRPSPGR